MASELEGGAQATLDDHGLTRQLRLRDLVLAQVLTVVGSSWVGIAAGVGRAQLTIWLDRPLRCFTRRWRWRSIT